MLNEDFVTKSEGMFYCEVCKKFINPEEGRICAICGTCDKCCEHAECKSCGRLLNGRLHILCSNCGSCSKCCTCIKCTGCHEFIQNVDRLEGNSICLSCNSKVTGYIKAGVVGSLKGAGTNQIEHKLMDFYALSEIEGQVLRAKNDEGYRKELKIEMCEVEDLLKEFTPVFKSAAENLARMYFDYLYGCCLGEIGHLCRQTSCRVGVGVFCRGEKGREFLIQHSGLYSPEKSLKLMELFFTHEFWKGNGSFGGEKWQRLLRLG